MSHELDNMSPSADAGTQASPVPDGRLEDLAQIIRAYNQVTENLQKSHESLTAQVELLRDQLASADAQLLRSKRLAALGEMAAGIAHEVRNPLAAIQLYANMIVQDLREHAKGSDKVGLAPSLDAACKITSAVRGLNAIVNDVLAFARDLAPRREPVDVASLITRVLETQMPAIEAASVRVICSEEPGIALSGDADLLHQALVNIVRNAVEAMADSRSTRRAVVAGSAGKPEASASVLTIESRAVGRFVVLTISDTGAGISAEHIDRIFNPFFTTRNTGTGLGLAIVHRIIDAHGGSIAVHNDPRTGGAVFELSLPASLDVGVDVALAGEVASAGMAIASDVSRSLT